jgi:hypothetical protein
LPNTLCPHPTDRRMWKRALARVHPDSGGSEALFVWLNNVRGYVLDDTIEDEPQRARREPPEHPRSGERIAFSEGASRFHSHHHLTRHIVKIAESYGEYGWVLSLLEDCYPAPARDLRLQGQEAEGATYRQIAYISHLANFDSDQRRQLYRICEGLPLSQRQAGHIIKRLKS